MIFSKIWSVEQAGRRSWEAVWLLKTQSLIAVNTCRRVVDPITAWPAADGDFSSCGSSNSSRFKFLGRVRRGKGAMKGCSVWLAAGPQCIWCALLYSPSRLGSSFSKALPMATRTRAESLCCRGKCYIDYMFHFCNIVVHPHVNAPNIC